MDGDGHVCISCGTVTRDVYWNEPGSWVKLKQPMCASCYERGWLFYWRERAFVNYKHRVCVKAVRTASFRKR